MQIQFILLPSLLRILFFLSFFWVQFFFWPASLWAQVIFYPGTFDPFHLTHWEEAQYALKKYPESKLVILPIEEAYYTPKVKGTNVIMPFIFPFKTRLEMLDNLFKDQQRVEISPHLQRIDHDVFATLTELAQQWPTPENENPPFLLIGQDVLERWRSLPGFAQFSSRFQLLVSLDPKAPPLIAKTPEISKNSLPPIFLPITQKGIRSWDLYPHIVKQSPVLKKALPPASYDFLFHDLKNYRRIVDSYQQRLEKYLTLTMTQEIFPLLQAKNFSPELIDNFQKNPHLIKDLILLKAEGDQGRIEKMKRNLPFPLSVTFGPQITKVFQWPEVQEKWRLMDYGQMMLKVLDSSSAPPCQTVSPSPDSYLNQKSFPLPWAKGVLKILSKLKK